MPALDHLPVELLYEIYATALSPTLPLACKYLYSVFKAAPATLHAEFLIGCYEEFSRNSGSGRAYGLISKVLRYPLCTRQVLEAILRSPHCPYIPPSGHQERRPTVLPKRLFRHLTPSYSSIQVGEGLLSFLHFLYDDPRIPSPDADSHDGYALTKAVYAGYTELVRFLLKHGASPDFKNHLAVIVAIRRKSLPLVRMLIERDSPGASSESSPSSGRRKRKREGGSESQEKASHSAKRRKLGDRVAVNPDMLKAAVKCNARDVVEYLMREKGCVPDMQTVLMMGG
ncbi:hypothetical protein C8Q78DRAFT_1028767 [Trametes maxima]|nr:hypothetical protein C8Q78DRAFT_1028767 [Trametes maxima]